MPYLEGDSWDKRSSDAVEEQRARNRARQRALADLAERYREDYEQLYRDHREAEGLPSEPNRLAHRRGRARHGRAPL